MTRIFSAILLACLIGLFVAGCSASDNTPGDKAEIPESDRAITFDGGTEGPVVFNHEQHSTEYYDGVCLACHDHEDVTGQTRWSCRECHTAGEDREDLCEEVDAYHGCIMTQCQNCHVLEGPPAPDGASCGVLAGGCHF